MRVDVGGKRIQIDFVHEQFQTPQPLPVQNGEVLVKGWTTAMAEEVLGQETEPLATGVAWCSARDIFSKEKGRKVSLTNLLANLQLPKGDRKVVWDAYLRRG